MTIEAWFQLASATEGFDIAGYGENSGNGSRVALGWDGSNGLLEFENMDVSGPLPFDANWHHMVGVYGGGVLTTATSQLYLDGNVVSNATTGGTPAITTTEFKIGGIPTVRTCCAMNGSIDEVRVSSGTRSVDWIATEYANQSSPWTFYTVETTGGLPTPVVSSLSPAAGGSNAAVAINVSNFGTTQGGSSVSFNGTAPSSISELEQCTDCCGDSFRGDDWACYRHGKFCNEQQQCLFHGEQSADHESLASCRSSRQLRCDLWLWIGPPGNGGYVMFNGAICNIQTWSDNTIEVVVPDAATTGPVTVTVNGISSNGAQFTVEVPAGIGTI